MSISKTMLTGGNFQDSEGNVLANGYLKMVLSSDESVNDSQICSGISLNIILDGNGSAAAYPTIPADQYVWANDVMSPTNSFYTVTGYTSAGQPAWGPNNQQVTSGGVGGGTFDIGTWIPNQVISWSPSVQSTELEVNGSPSSSQSLLNLVDSASVTVVDNGDGAISFDASVQSLDLEINNSPASSQSLQNLVNSGTVTVVDNGGGNISFAAAAGGMPTPDEAQWRLWEATSNSNTTFNGYGETISISDGGASSGYVAATSTTGAAFEVTVTINQYRYYLGALFAYPSGRETTFETIITPSFSNAAALGNIRMGLSDASANEISFYAINTGGGWSNWKILTLVSGSYTYNDTDIPVSEATRTKLSYSISGAGVISWKINGATGTMSPTLPAAPIGLLSLLEASNSSYNLTTTVEYLYATNATP